LALHLRWDLDQNWWFLFVWSLKAETGGSRPARRHPFCPGGHKKEAKKDLLLAEGISFASFHSF
jgi:hypothetical protein